MDETLCEIIQREMLSDDECPERVGKRLINTFDAADAKGRELINDIFMTLTGWNFETLRSMAADV